MPTYPYHMFLAHKVLWSYCFCVVLFSPHVKSLKSSAVAQCPPGTKSNRSDIGMLTMADCIPLSNLDVIICVPHLLSRILLSINLFQFHEGFACY